MSGTTTQCCLFCLCRQCIPSGDRNRYCPLCKATFDPEDDGDAAVRPERRMEREEEQRERRLARMTGRRER